MLKKTLTLGLILFLSTSVFSQKWKTYPYTPLKSAVSFPVDEGRHDKEIEEWWYTSGHLVGQTTGKQYSYMICYFYYPIGSASGFRILYFSDDDNELNYNDMQLLNYTVLATDKLDILVKKFDGNTEYWKNKYDGKELVPFEYNINAQSQVVSLDLAYKSNKPPLILGEGGYILISASHYTYYYSQTGVNVTGSITYNGITENITGTSWIDRQYGNFNPATDGLEYECLGIQLSNNMDIMIWNVFTAKDKIPDDKRFKIFAAYVNDHTQYTGSDFKLKRLEFSYSPDKQKCYAKKWQLTSSKNNIDLIITSLFSDSEVNLPVRFYEGTTSITGTVNGRSVTGKGFAELLHSYDEPNIIFTNEGEWNNSIPIKWKLKNPDDGNPIKYSLEYSIDGQKTYNEIFSDISETHYIWNSKEIPSGNQIWFRLRGKSVDGTLKSSVTKKFVLSPKS